MTGINLSGWIDRTSITDRRLILRWQQNTCPKGEPPSASLIVGSDEEWPFFAIGDVVAYSRNIPQSISVLSAMRAGEPNPRKPNFFEIERAPAAPITLVPAAGVTVEAPSGFTLAVANGWSLVFLVKTAASAWAAHGDLVPT